MHDMEPIGGGSVKSYSFTCENPGLVPGRYKTCLVLYEVDELGDYVDLDAVWPGFVFDIIDADGKIKIKWSTRNWGRICFETIN